MPNGDPTISRGILRTRDLVELYYGARMVGATKRQTAIFDTNTSPQLILGQDVRRISYEIVLASATGLDQCLIGSPAEIDAGFGLLYVVTYGGPFVIKRDFYVDLDTVCEPLVMKKVAGTVVATVREVILTPLPVDESP